MEPLGGIGVCQFEIFAIMAPKETRKKGGDVVALQAGRSLGGEFRYKDPHMEFPVVYRKDRTRIASLIEKSSRQRGKDQRKLDRWTAAKSCSPRNIIV